jgi:hypothetical protein
VGAGITGGGATQNLAAGSSSPIPMALPCVSTPRAQRATQSERVREDNTLFGDRTLKCYIFGISINPKMSLPAGAARSVLPHSSHTWFGEFLWLIGRIVAAVSLLSHSGSGIDSIASPDRLEARVSRQDGAGDRQHCGRRRCRSKRQGSVARILHFTNLKGGASRYFSGLNRPDKEHMNLDPCPYMRSASFMFLSSFITTGFLSTRCYRSREDWPHRSS